MSLFEGQYSERSNAPLSVMLEEIELSEINLSEDISLNTT